MPWTPLDSVVLDWNLESWLDDYASRVSFPIVVTSGIRTPRKQAKAMFTKIELGDDLLKIYKDDTFAQKIIDSYPNLDKAERIVSEYAKAGGGSSHLRGMGVDIRTRDLTESQKQELVQAVKDMGDSPLLESTPPHLHITLKKKRVQETNLRSLAIILVLIGGAVWTLK